MRLRSLSIAGFRAFPERVQLDLDANSIVILGANGQGKTSIYDAILWGLAGNVPRLRGGKNIVSMYSRTGEARVSIGLSSPAGDPIEVSRSTSEGEDQLLLRAGDVRLQGEPAAAWLSEALQRHPGPGAMPDLAVSITRSVYLQQDLVREFIDSDDEKGRFSAVSELIGTGRVTEFQAALSKARRSWNRAVGELQAERAPKARDVEQLESELQRLGESRENDRGSVLDDTNSWIAELRSHAVDLATDLSHEEAPALGLQLLKNRRAELGRREEALQSIRTLALEAPEPTEHTTEAIAADLKAAVSALEAARAGLVKAQESVARQRERLVALSNEREEMRALASLASRHLEGPCPVCQQEHDVEKTRAHLALVASEEGRSAGLEIDESELVASAKAVREAEQAVAREQARDAAQRSHIDARSRWKAELKRRLEELEPRGLDLAGDLEGQTADPSQLVPAVEKEVALAAERTDSLRSLASRGEQLALRMARARDERRRAALEERLREAKRVLDAHDSEYQARDRAGKLAADLVDVLKEAANNFVNQRIGSIAPLLQMVYSSIDPHPTLRAVKLLSEFSYGSGRLRTEVRDPINPGVHTTTPEHFLSSSQSNALAVAVFLSLNMGLKQTPLRAALLDDPLQSLDDINLLNLLDLIRRVAKERQLIVSTHDRRFSRLLETKLRPVAEGQRTIVIELEGWGRSGPQVTQRDVLADTGHNRLVG